MFSLFQKNVVSGRQNIFPIDPITFLLCKEDGNFEILRKGKRVRTFSIQERGVGFLLSLPSTHPYDCIDRLPLYICSHLPITGKIFTCVCDIKNTRLTELRNENVIANFDNGIPPSHTHTILAPAVGPSGMLMLVKGRGQISKQYYVYRKTRNGIESIFSPAAGAYIAGEPTATENSGLIFYDIASGMSIFLTVYDQTPDNFKLMAHRLHSDLGWLPSTNLFNVDFKYEGPGISLAVDRREIRPKIVAFFGSSYARVEYKTIYKCKTLVNGTTIQNDQIPVEIVANKIFKDPKTCVTTCPCTGKIIVYYHKYREFYYYLGDDNFERIVFKNVKSEPIKIPNVYKQLLKQCGVVSPANKEIQFKVEVTTPAQIFLKDTLDSKVDGDKLKIVIRKKDHDEDNVYVELWNKTKEINHEFVVPKELWDKAFTYKEKRSIISDKAPILRFLRMIQGVEHIKPKSSMSQIVPSECSPAVKKAPTRHRRAGLPSIKFTNTPVMKGVPKEKSGVKPLLKPFIIFDNY